MSKEKKGAKFGRHSKRSPAAASYRGSNRRATNKAKKAKKEAKRQERQAGRIIAMKNPRGTARRKRRLGKQAAYQAALISAAV